MNGFTNENVISQLIQLQQKPEPFTPGEDSFWDDPHISSQMLDFHLNPGVEAASRRPETIDRSVKWMMETLDLKPGDAVLDLGCGPGLYTSRFARAGLQVTGVDYSQRSIDYAIRYASENKLNIRYRYQNYLELDDESQYKAVFLIYGDFCPLNPEQRSTLLCRIHRALKPGGSFVLDVTTRECRKKHGVKNGWYATEGGFWKPGPHLVLENGFDYPEQSLWLDQYIVVETDGKVTIYRNWFQDYTPEAIADELSRAGFCVESMWSDLTGTPYKLKSEWIGVVTSRT
jgi:2-polyprenyl-3-methyl-5-hydroxy-6-metoxy-1,4-benzoquinol methylase